MKQEKKSTQQKILTGKSILEERKKLKISQKTLATKSGVSEKTLSFIENHRTRLTASTESKISQALQKLKNKGISLEKPIIELSPILSPIPTISGKIDQGEFKEQDPLHPYGFTVRAAPFVKRPDPESLAPTQMLRELSGEGFEDEERFIMVKNTVVKFFSISHNEQDPVTLEEMPLNQFLGQFKPANNSKINYILFERLKNGVK